MKKFYLIKAIVLLSANGLYAQTTSLYKGTWHHQDDNQLFTVSIWIEGNAHYGHYKMVEYNNGVTGNVIYDSNRDYGNGNRHHSTIFASVSGQYGLVGNICDNIAIDNCKTGDFQMKLLPLDQNCSTCSLTASWKVNEPIRDLIVEEEPPFIIPTDIILTQVSGTVGSALIKSPANAGGFLFRLN